MAAPKRITIIGGGLAGLALGIGLRQRGVPVVIWEAGPYPRHRVCGEFISGRGRECLSNLGLTQQLFDCGGREGRTARFFSGGAVSPRLNLPQPALCLSRYRLDALLAREFRQLGGDLMENKRWQSREAGEGVVRATGRRVQPIADGWRWIGLKVHARGVPLEADLEMHFLPNGYVGLCRLEGGEVNVCGLFRSRTTLPELGRAWFQLVRGMPGSDLDQRFAKAVLDDRSFCCVAGLSFQTGLAPQPGACVVGDALALIPPVTGNGMSMAFESAEGAAGPLSAYSSGTLAWRDALERIDRHSEAHFRRRLQWARGLQSAIFSSPARLVLMPLVFRIPKLIDFFFRRTR